MNDRAFIYSACLLFVTFAQISAAATPVQPATIQILERGPNHRVVQTTRPLTNELGELTVQTNHYTELAGGLHYYENGQWTDSEERIEVNSEGYATATRGAYKVIFSPNLNTVGAIDVLAPDQKRLRSHVVGVYL